MYLDLFNTRKSRFCAHPSEIEYCNLISAGVRRKASEEEKKKGRYRDGKEKKKKSSDDQQ